MTQKIVLPLPETAGQFILPFSFPVQPQQALEPVGPHVRAELELQFEPLPSTGSRQDPLIVSAVAFKNLDRITNIDDPYSGKELDAITLSVATQRPGPEKGRTPELRKVNYAVPSVTRSGVGSVCVAGTENSW